MNELDDALSLTEVAALAEVGISAVSNWRKRHRDFPAPHSIDGQELYGFQDVATWLTGRRISKNDLKASEAAGTTYGDRFRRNRGKADAEPDTAKAAVRRTDHEHRLWTAVDRLRGSRSPRSIIDHVLGLLYLKIHSPGRWRSLVGAPHWTATRELLASATLETPAGSRLPIFDVVAGTAPPDPSITDLIQVIDVLLTDDPAERLDTAARLCDELLERVESDLVRDNGHRTPTSLARCMVAIVDPHSTDRVYDPICGSGELLATAGRNLRLQGVNEPEVFGQARDERSWRTTNLNLFLHGARGDVRPRGVPFDDDAFSEERFDVVLANPPFNFKHGATRPDRFPFGPPSERNANFAWLQHAVTKLDEGGRAAILMPDGSTFTMSPRDHEIRRAMIEAGVVDCVVALPGNLFKSTAITTCLWVLRRVGDRRSIDEILFMDATGMGIVMNRKDRTLSDEETERITTEYKDWTDARHPGEYSNSAGFTRSVSHSEIRSNDWILQPTRYVRNAGDERRYSDSPMVRSAALRSKLGELHDKAKASRAELDARLASMSASVSSERGRAAEWSSVPLGEVVDVLAGPGTMTREGTGTSWIPIVLPRNIWSGRVDQGDVDAVAAATAARQSRYRLDPGDIVCARTGTLGRYGLVSTSQAGWLVGPGCMRLRPNHRVRTAYLMHYLASPEAFEWLMANSVKSVIRSISTNALRQLPVPLPPMPKQDEIVATLAAFDDQISTHRHLAEESEKLRDLLLPLVRPSTTELDD